MDKRSKLQKQTVLAASDNISDLLQIARLLKIKTIKKFSVEEFKPKEWLRFENAFVCITPINPTGRHRRTLAGNSVEYLEKSEMQAVEQFRIVSGTTFVGRTEPQAIVSDSTQMVFEEIKLSYGQAEFMLLKNA